MKTERRVVFEEPSSSSDTKFYVMLNTMEKLVDKLTPSRSESQPQVKNPNFRRPPRPQAHQKNPEEKQTVKPPFPENFLDEEDNEETEQQQINCFNDE